MRSRVSTSRLLARAQKKQKSAPGFMQNFFTTPHQSWLDTNGEPLAGGAYAIAKKYAP